MNIKKVILSMVAFSALGSSLNADVNALYIPMTTKNYDKAWIMFGVNNFATGVATLESASGVFSNGYTPIDEDSVSDDLATPASGIGPIDANVSGFQDRTGDYNLATFQALRDANGAPYFTVPLTLALDTTGLSYSETQSVRSMYIAIRESATATNVVAKIKLDYKAVLEGRTGEIQLDHTGNVYTFTISQTATYNTPAIAQYVAPVTVATALTRPEDLIVYDLAQAPVNAITYDRTRHQGTTRGSERFYHYDAVNGNWLLWDRTRVTNNQNTLINFEKGKAYWGRIDINGDTTTTSDARAGLYLAKTGNSEANASVYRGRLTPDSWNMIAFDPASSPDIRNATTGLVISTNALGDGDALTLTDETGINSVTVTFATAANYPNDVDRAFYINNVIATKKYLGEVPKSFAIKAFATNNSDELLFLSDKQFTVKDTNGDMLSGAKTIADNDVLTFDGSVAAVTDVGDGTSQANSAATSRYGEYSLIIKPLVGANTASALDHNVSSGGANYSAAVQFGNINGDSLNGASTPTPKPLANGGSDEASTLTTAQEQLESDDIFNGNSSNGRILQVDTDFNGVVDMLLLATDKAFYMKDHTYTRVYSVNSGVDGTEEVDNNVTLPSYTVKNTNSATLIPDHNATATEFATQINSVADTGTSPTKTYAAADTANNLVVVTADSSLMDLIDANSADRDYFQATSSSDLISKGAVSQVLSISKLSRADIVLNKAKIAFTNESNSTEAIDITLTVGTTNIDPVDTAGINTVGDPDDTNRFTILNSLVDNLNSAFVTSNVPAFAYHTYVDGYAHMNKAVIYIEGVDISNVTFNKDADGNGTDNNLSANISDIATNAGKIDLDATAIVSDLKDNAIYSPDYVNSGPLYTLKEAGYEAKVIVRPSTNIAALPTTHWDGIDLTKPSSEWLKYNEYNLFSVDERSGYWVYVTNYTPPTFTVANTVFSPTYAYHFDRNNNTQNIISSVSFSTQIDGLDPTTSNSKLIIGGNEVSLINTGSTYTANISSYETTLLTQQINTFILVATNGLGDRLVDNSFVTLDYEKPETPTITFSAAATATFATPSTDVAAYYLWKDFVPDEGTDAIGPISLTDASAYNMCQNTAFGTTQNYQLVAIDGAGVFGQGNISNTLSFNFANTIKGATVLTHNFGDSASTVVNYDSSCIANTDIQKHGVEVFVQTVGSVRLAYEPEIYTGENANNDVPLTAYYAVPSAVTNAVVRIDLLDLYVGKKFYIEYNGALYSGRFPSDAGSADASFLTPIVLTAESNVANQTLR